MIVRDISFHEPHENILYDEVLLMLAEKGQGGEVLRFWESSSYFVVLGLIGKVEDDLKQKSLKTDGIPVTRRASGGGTVLQGKGCLNYSFILDKNRSKDLQDIKKSYRYILSSVIAALETCGVKAVFYPGSDLGLENQKKFSGNAQKRGRNFILHHGTLLYDFALPLIEEYLSMPKIFPEYRMARKHQDFVTNISISSDDFKIVLPSILKADNFDNDIRYNEEKLLKEIQSSREVYVAI